MSGPHAWAVITLGLVLFAGGLWAAVARHAPAAALRPHCPAAGCAMPRWW